MRYILAFVLILSLGCRTAAPERKDSADPEVRIETLFVEPGHAIAWCAKDAAPALLERPDGVIFHDADSVIRIRVPRAEGQVPYHAHLLHGTSDLHVAQAEDGTLAIDLAKIAEPALLVVSSATARMQIPKVPEREMPLLAPYTASFRLIPRAHAATLSSLQPFRYEWAHPRATVSLFVQTFNRSDMLVTLSDPGKGADYLFADGAIRSSDAILVPRMTVEVSEPTGRVWFRTGAYPVPEGAAECELSLAGLRVIPFAPPPRVELAFLDERPATSLRIAARFHGVSDRRRPRFILAAAHPVGGAEKIRVRIQEHEVAGELACLFDFSDLDAAHFPWTGYVAHRLVEPWRTTGGFHSPCAPLSVEPRGSDGPPASAHLPAFASHCAMVTLLGKGRLESELPPFLGAYLSPRPGRAYLARPIPVPWTPVRPVVGVPATPVRPRPTRFPTTGAVAASTPVDVVAAVVRAGVQPIHAEFDADSARLLVPEEGGLRAVTFRFGSETRLPQGLRPVAVPFHDPDAAEVAIRTGLPVRFTGRAAEVPVQALWTRAEDWRTAYDDGNRRAREREESRDPASTSGFDFWPGYRPREVRAAREAK